jgi:hypothetical protein
MKRRRSCDSETPTRRELLDSIRLHGSGRFLKKDWPDLLACFDGNARLAANHIDEGLQNVSKQQLDKLVKRQQLGCIETIQDLFDLVRRAQNILILSGAGISVNCGIPDFRSPKSGLYALIDQEMQNAKSTSKYVQEHVVGDAQEIVRFKNPN